MAIIKIGTETVVIKISTEKYLMLFVKIIELIHAWEKNKERQKKKKWSSPGWPQTQGDQRSYLTLPSARTTA